MEKPIRNLIFITITMVFFSNLIAAQRGSYAGNRPSTGLNQKHKYQQQSAANNNNSINSRFGEAENRTNTLQYGVPQRPPVGFIVTPQAVYEPLPERQQPQFTLDNRLGGTDGANMAANANAGIGVNRPVAPLPVDALGDRDFIDQLNAIPEDRRPFWFLNSQAIEAQRNGTPNFAGPVASRGSFFG